MANPHWSQLKESGSPTGLNLLLFTYRMGGRLLFQIFLFPVICFYVLFRRDSYRASRQYLARLHQFNAAFPAPRPWHVFAHFWNFATSLLDKISVWMGAITIGDVVLHNREVLDALLAEKQGALILISHLGNFEICQALSEQGPKLSLTVLHHTRHAAKFNRVLNQYKSASSITLLQVTELGMGVAMQLGAKIGAGEFLAMAADRVAIDNPDSALTVDFLGRPAPFPSGPFVLGLALQAPIVTLFCIKQAGRYNIYFESLSTGGAVKRAERNQVMTALMQQYVRRLEYYCVRSPLQWYNFYSFWHPDSPAGDSKDLP